MKTSLTCSKWQELTVKGTHTKKKKKSRLKNYNIPQKHTHTTHTQKNESVKKIITSHKNTHKHPIVTPISLILMGFIHNWVIMRFHSSIDWCVVGFIYNWVGLKFHSFIHPSIHCCVVGFIHSWVVLRFHPSIHPSIGVLFDCWSSWAKPLVVLSAQKVCRSGMIPGLQGKGA